MPDKEQQAKKENVLTALTYILFALCMVFFICAMDGNGEWPDVINYFIAALLFNLLSFGCGASAWLVGNRSSLLSCLLVFQMTTSLLFAYVIVKF